MNATITSLHQKALLAIENKEYRTAHQHLITIIQIEPHFADAYFLLGIIASDHNQLFKAIKLFIQADALQANNIKYNALLAKLYALTFQPILAQKTLHLIETKQEEKTNGLLDNNTLKPLKVAPYILDTIGVTYSYLGLHEKSITYFKQACLDKPSNANYLFNLATGLRFIGEFNQARKYYKQAIQYNSHLYKAYSGLSSLSDDKNRTSIDELSLLYKSLINKDDKLHIGHALAREYELSTEYDLCFNVLIKTKAEKLHSIDYSINHDKALFKAIKEQFRSRSKYEKDISPSINEQHTSPNKPNEAVFIVGMPRTGTTLVERILTNHPDVTSAGELQNFGRLFKEHSQTKTPHVIDKVTIENSHNINFNALGKDYINSTRNLTGNTEYFIDKMPLNVLYAGFIIKALPNVKVICLDRNPLDTIVSNFKQLFSINSPQYNYAYDLHSTAEFYLLFRDLALFWQQNYPENFYIINYESLVKQPDIESKKLFSFCELSWKQEYLDITNNKSPVATASTLQVRKPIHSNSVDYWKNFNAYLHDVKAILKCHLH